MVGKSKKSLFISIILILSFMTGCGANNGGASNKKVSIGITQIAEHPALDAAREGFIEALKSKGYEEGKNLNVEFKNAQGDIAVSNMVAQNFVSQNKNLIFAIATPAAQAAFNATKNIPIIATAVTDPVKVGIVKDLEKSGTNVTGTSDAVPLDKQLKLIKDVFPKSKKVGILYSTSEVNSEVQLIKAKEISKNYDLEVEAVGVNNINEIGTALDVLLSKVDVLYTLTDNLIASSIPLISKKALEKNIPVIGGEEAHVKNGALITDGINYKKLGFEAGLKAVEVLEGKNVKEMSFSNLKDTEIVINKDTLEKLGINIPKDILDKAKLVKGDK